MYWFILFMAQKCGEPPKGCIELRINWCRMSAINSIIYIYIYVNGTLFWNSWPSATQVTKRERKNGQLNEGKKSFQGNQKKGNHNTYWLSKIHGICRPVYFRNVCFLIILLNKTRSHILWQHLYNKHIFHWTKRVIIPIHGLTQWEKRGYNTNIGEVRSPITSSAERQFQ